MAKIKLVLSGHLSEPLNSDQLNRLNKWLMCIVENMRITIINVCSGHLDAYVRMSIMEAAVLQRRKREDMCVNLGPLHKYKNGTRRRKSHAFSQTQLDKLNGHNPQLMIALGDVDPTTRLLWKDKNIISISFPRAGNVGDYACSKVLQDHLNMGISQMIEGCIPPIANYEDCKEKLSLKIYLDTIAQRFIEHFKARMIPAVQLVLNLDDRIRNAGIQLQPTT